MTGAQLRGLLVVGLGTAVVPLDASVNVAFPLIAAHFGLDIPAIRFVVISYVLVYASLMLAFGRIGDLLGYRRVFVAGCAISTLAFILCSLAPNFGSFLAGRALQGVGAALVLSVGPALATDLLGEARRAEALGWYGGMMALAATAGPLFAGVLLEAGGWSSVYLFRIPIALAGFLLAFRLPDRKPRAAGRFDLAGGALLALSIAALVLTFDLLRNLPDGIIGFAAAVAGAMLSLLAFIWRQRVAAAPIIALEVFRRSSVAAITIASVLVNLGWFVVPLLLPFYLNRYGGLSLAVGGALLAIGPVGSIAASALAGRLARRIPGRRIAQAGAGLVGLSVLGIAMVVPGAPLTWLAAAMLVQGVGVGLFQVAALEILASSLPPEDRGVAGSLGMVSRTLGTLSGASLLMLIFQASPDFLAGFQHANLLAAALALVGLVALGLGK